MHRDSKSDSSQRTRQRSEKPREGETAKRRLDGWKQKTRRLKVTGEKARANSGSTGAEQSLSSENPEGK